MRLGLAIDRAIGVFAPSYARARAESRLRLETVARTLEAGTYSRTSARRRARREGPVERGRRKLESTRAQARDLYRTNPYARGVVNSMVANLIGCGIRPEPKVQKLRGRGPNEEVNDALRDAWKRWADGADTTGRISFYELQGLAMKELIVCGEALAVFSVPEDDRLIPLAVDVVPSERLAHDLDVPSAKSDGGNQIIQGVEFTPQGQIAAYWIYPQHPDDFILSALPQRAAKRVPADDVLHIFDRLEAGQVRGLTRFITIAPVIEALEQFCEHELTKARVASSFAVMITQSGDHASLPIASDSEDETDAVGNEVGQIDPGMIWRGESGEGLQVAQPAIQSTAFDEFVTLQLRQIARAFDVSYELLSRDFTKVTYLSARQGENQDRRHWEPQQEALNRSFNCPAWNRFVAAAAIAGVIRLGQQKPEKFCDVDFVPPGWSWIDPSKDLRANVEGIQAGILSAPQVIRRRGADPRQVLEENARFKEEAEELGLRLSIFEVKTNESQETAPEEEDAQESGDGAQGKEEEAAVGAQ